MAQKSWTYEEITKCAEKTIIGLMKQGQKSKCEHTKRYAEKIARGVRDGWYQLTVGWQNIGDAERMEALHNPDNYK